MRVIHVVHVIVMITDYFVITLIRKVMVMPRLNKTPEGEINTLGVFVQCTPDAHDTP